MVKGLGSEEDATKKRDYKRPHRGSKASAQLPRILNADTACMNTCTVPPWAKCFACILLILKNGQERYCCPHFTVREQSLRKVKQHDSTKVAHWEREETGFKIRSGCLGRI